MLFFHLGFKIVMKSLFFTLSIRHRQTGDECINMSLQYVAFNENGFLMIPKATFLSDLLHFQTISMKYAQQMHWFCVSFTKSQDSQASKHCANQSCHYAEQIQRSCTSFTAFIELSELRDTAVPSPTADPSVGYLALHMHK